MLQGIAGGWGGENGANEGEASESKAPGGSSILDSWSEAVDALSSFSLPSEELAELQNQIVESPSLSRFVTALGDINARALFVLKVRNWAVLFHNVLPSTPFPTFLSFLKGFPFVVWGRGLHAFLSRFVQALILEEYVFARN